jgi:hypothetical protein
MCLSHDCRDKVGAPRQVLSRANLNARKHQAKHLSSPHRLTKAKRLSFCSKNKNNYCCASRTPFSIIPCATVSQFGKRTKNS